MAPFTPVKKKKKTGGNSSGFLCPVSKRNQEILKINRYKYANNKLDKYK